MVAAILASALGFIDGSVIAIAIPSMRESLGASLVQVQWIHTAYLLTLSALTLVGGAMGDRFGLAKVFGLGIAIFVLSSVVCALAADAEMLIAARAVQGIGAAMMVPGSLAVISRAYPRQERGAAIGTWAAASAVTTAAGPIVGGLVLTLGDTETWRWVFAINLPLGLLALGLLWHATTSDPGRPGDPVDWVGASLATLTLGALAWALTGGEGHILWTYMLIGAAAFAGFLWAEQRHPAPMIDLQLFRIRAFSAVNAMTLTFYFAFSTIMFFLPMLLISGWGMGELEAAAAFAPLSVFIGGFSARIGRFADQYGARPFLTGGALIVALAFVGLALAIPTEIFWTRVFIATTVMGMGMAMIVTPLSTAVMAAAGDRNTGAASGVNNAIARMAGLFSVAVMGSVAALVYARSAGALSFGVSMPDDAAHVAAMNAAFVALSWSAAALAALSAAIAWFGLAPQAGSGKARR